MAKAALAATNSTRFRSARAFFRTVIMGIWIVPESQVYVLNLASRSTSSVSSTSVSRIAFFQSETFTP